MNQLQHVAIMALALAFQDVINANARVEVDDSRDAWDAVRLAHGRNDRLQEWCVARWGRDEVIKMIDVSLSPVRTRRAANNRRAKSAK